MITEDGRTDPENSEEEAEAGGGGGGWWAQIAVKYIFYWLKNSYKETLFSFFYNERKILRIQSLRNSLLLRNKQAKQSQRNLGERNFFFKLSPCTCFRCSFNLD